MGTDISNATHEQIEYKWDNFLRKNLIFPFTANYDLIIDDVEREIQVNVLGYDLMIYSKLDFLVKI